MATATLKNLENLNLEALSAVDLSSNYEALTQTVGGSRVIYRSFNTGSSNTSTGFVQKVGTSAVDAYDDKFKSTIGDVYLGRMTKNSNGSYSGTGVNNLRLFANRLLFNNADTVYYEGIK